MGTAQGFEEFVSIVDNGSLTAAARQLGLPRPTLSRRLAQLEQRLGVRLLHRTTRRLNMTPQGQTLYDKAQRVVQMAREVEAEVQRLDGVPRGLLRVATPPGMVHTALAEWLAEFMDRYPEVQFEVVASSVHIDLVAEGFDVALRAGVIEDSSLIVRTLARMTTVAVASPTYLARHGTPTTLEQLADHNCILGYSAGVTPIRHWPLLDGGSVAVSGSFRANQSGLRTQAALRHLGIALTISTTAAGLGDNGTLVPVLPELIGRQERLCMLYPDRTFLDPKVRAFVDFIAERIRLLA